MELNGDELGWAFKFARKVEDGVVRAVVAGEQDECAPVRDLPRPVPRLHDGSAQQGAGGHSWARGDPRRFGHREGQAIPTEGERGINVGDVGHCV